MSEDLELPRGWITAKLEEFCVVIMGQSPPSSAYNQKEDGLPFFQGKADFTNLYPKVRIWCTQPTKIAEKNDVLLSIRAPVGPTNLAPSQCSIGRGLAAIRPEGNINERYILYAIRTFNSDLKDQGTGTTFEAVSGDTVRSFKIPLAPAPEQERIVAAIEQQLSRIDAGVALFRQAQKKLKQYRASVLKAAVEGTLTTEWRAEHPDVEPASELLKRILKERRTRWEEEQRAKGKDPKKVHYVEPAGPDLSGLPNLPEGWSWATIQQLSTRVVDGTHHAPIYIPTGIPFISVKDIQGGKISFNNCKYISQEEHEQLIQRCHPEHADVVITKSGTIGRVAVIKTDRPFSLFVSVALIKTCKQYLNQDYFKLALEYYILGINIQQSIKGGLIKNFHLEDLCIVPLKLPSLAEQEQIVSLVEERLSLADALETAIEHGLKRAEKERQSILHQAFTGQLVPQDPDDEPASVLLERIRKERNEREKQTKQAQRTYSEKREPNKRKQKLVAEARPVEFVQPELIDVDETVQCELWQIIDAN